MIALLALLAVAGAGDDDPCSAPATPPPEPADRASAADYRAVGDEERTAGDAAAARIAYREALRRNPADIGARAGLEALCRPAPATDAATARAPDRFQDGVELMRRGDRAGAIAAFASVRAGGADRAAALLQGICELELGHDERARALLDEAAREPLLAGTASFFLGLIALHDGESARAVSLFSTAAAGDRGIAESALRLRRVADRDGHLVASVLTEVGFDSNVELTPDGTPAGAGSADGHGAVVAGLQVRPFASSGLYARATGQYRKQVRITSYDLGAAGGALGIRHDRGGSYVVGEYAYDFVSLADAPYLSAHRLLATGRWTKGQLSLTGAYAARFESFLTDASAGYSGVRHDGDVDLRWRLGLASMLGLGYRVERDMARDQALGYLEHGPLAIARLALGPEMRLALEGRFAVRDYGVVDPDLAVRRADRYIDGIAVFEVDVSARWTVRATALVRRALSNLPDFQYTKVTGGISLVYTMGVP